MVVLPHPVQSGKTSQTVYIWGLYVVGLVVSTVVVFATVGDSLDKERFLGPNVLNHAASSVVAVEHRKRC